MSGFVPPRRKIFELLFMFVLIPLIYIVKPSVDAVALFCFGYIWNWSASNDLSYLEGNARYRMSTLKIVVNLQNLILRPFIRAPLLVRKIVQVLPAGIFWFAVVYINDSVMPWWVTFVGSAAFELTQINVKNTQKEIV